jgi:hypothetical protein
MNKHFFCKAKIQEDNSNVLEESSKCRKGSLNIPKRNWKNLEGNLKIHKI